MQPDNVIEEYLKKTYWVIDILPWQVAGDGKGQYFKIEKYYLRHPQVDAIYRHFGQLLIKLNCYEDICVCHSESWTENPEPETLEEWVSEREPLFVVLKSADAMIVISGDDHYMTLYNPNNRLLDLVRALAASENLFVWQPPR